MVGPDYLQTAYSGLLYEPGGLALAGYCPRAPYGLLVCVRAALAMPNGAAGFAFTAGR